MSVARHLSPEQARTVGRLVTAIHVRAQGGTSRREGLIALHSLHQSVISELGEGDPVALRVRLQLEMALSASRAREELVAGPRQLVDLCERYLPRSDEVAASARWLLAQSTRRAGDLDHAIEMYREEASLRERLIGQDSMLASDAQQDLAVALRDRGRPADLREALTITESEIALRTRLWGRDHPRTWVSQMALVHAHLLTAEASPAGRGGKAAEHALYLATEVAQKRKLRLGAKHPSTLRADRSRARALIAVGTIERAIWILRRVAAIEQVSGAEEPGVTDLHLARALSAQAKPADNTEAAALGERALSVLIGRFGDGAKVVTRAKTMLNGVAAHQPDGGYIAQPQINGIGEVIDE